MFRVIFSTNFGNAGGRLGAVVAVGNVERRYPGEFSDDLLSPFGVFNDPEDMLNAVF